MNQIKSLQFVYDYGRGQEIAQSLHFKLSDGSWLIGFVFWQHGKMLDQSSAQRIHSAADHPRFGLPFKSENGRELVWRPMLNEERKELLHSTGSEKDWFAGFWIRKDEAERSAAFSKVRQLESSSPELSRAAYLEYAKKFH